MDEDSLKFAEEVQKDDLEGIPEKYWKVMVVDDEPSVHDITQTSLKGFIYAGKKISFLHAYSGQEAKNLIHSHPDTALLLVDVVMETEDAGLNLVHYIRHKLKNHLTQIVIRTGQPGLAPEVEVISKYGINSYYSKTELKIEKLLSLVTTSFRMYEMSMNLSRELAKRRAAEASLTMLNRTLEKKIAERTREAVKANHLKSQFLANMSHEIRTPMNGIIGLSNILLEEDMPQTQKEYVSLIHHSAESLLTIINDILDLSKIESGQLDFEERTFSIKIMVKEVASVFGLKSKEKNIDILTHVSDTLPHFVQGDEVRVKQILLNLVGNAVKFTDRGHVRIGVDAGIMKDNRVMVTFDIEDTGPGVDNDFKQYLFDKFSQEDSSIARKFGGTGLGLAISRQLARMMHGDISVTDRPGGGAVFTACVLLKTTSKQDEKDHKEVQLPGARQLEEKIARLNPRILLAEDNPVNQKVIRVMLEKRNLSVDLAGDGEQVLDKLRTTEYDLVLMDVRMPGLDGIETTKIIRSPSSDIKNKKIPIVALTALAMPEDAEKCLASGMDGYLSKPVLPAKLLAAMATVLNIK